MRHQTGTDGALCTESYIAAACSSKHCTALHSLPRDFVFVYAIGRFLLVHVHEAQSTSTKRLLLQLRQKTLTRKPQESCKKNTELATAISYLFI